jgi:hypothetical protein
MGADVSAVRRLPSNPAQALGALGALAALPACFAPPAPVYGYDPGAEGCLENGAPAIGNTEINSWIDETLSEPPSEEDPDGLEFWLLSIHFDWIDPESGGSPPNMLGAYFNAEIFHYNVSSIVLNEAELESACAADNGGEDVSAADLCDASGHSMSGCSDAATCAQGEMTVAIVPAGDAFADSQEIELEFRVRDRCGATSNEKIASYHIGSGLAVENAESR